MAGAEAVTTAWMGWAGDMDRQLTLNRLDVMHRRLLDSYSYPQLAPRSRSRPGLHKPAQSRSYVCLGTPVATSQLNSKSPARHRPIRWCMYVQCRTGLPMAPPFQCKVAAGIGESCSRVDKLSHLELGVVQWQGKARHGPWLGLLAREGASGGRAHVERRDPPGRPATRAMYRTIPHASRIDTSVTLFPAFHPCFSPPLMNLKPVCFCDAELDEASLNPQAAVPAAMWTSHRTSKNRETVAG